TTITRGLGWVLVLALVGCGSSERKGIRSLAPSAAPSDPNEVRYLRHGSGTPRTPGPSLLDPARRGHPRRTETGTPPTIPPPLPAALPLVPDQDVLTTLTSADASFDPTKLCFQSQGVLQSSFEIAVTNQACDPSQFPATPDVRLYAIYKANPTARPNV